MFSGHGNLPGSFFDSGGEFLLWGTLANGDSLHVELFIGDGSQVSLVPVPGAAVLGVLGLSVAGGWLRRTTTRSTLPKHHVVGSGGRTLS